MTVRDELYTRRRKTPFDPFRLVKTDGQKIEVTEWFSFGFNEIMAFGAKDRGGSWQARFTEIARIEPLEATRRERPQTDRSDACARQDEIVFLLHRISINPAQCGGRPCIRGMRIRVGDVLDLLASGMSHDQVLAQLPDLEEDDIRASLAFAADRFCN